MIDLSDTPLPTLPDRDPHSHKGDYGRALIVGGSLGMAGAPALAGMACLRSGAGLVSLAVPACVQATAACLSATLMTHALPDDGEHVRLKAIDFFLQDAGDQAGVFAVGPGLGRSTELTDFCGVLFDGLRGAAVFDADGLNALAERRDAIAQLAYPRVLTPHAGEFARLSGEPLTDPNDDAERLDRSAQLAKLFGGPRTVVLLKGPRTVVTDGERFAINPTGNPGMATGGSGDVLTGVITALLAQGLDAFDAARLGAHVHGLAGDLAAAKLGQIGMIASDLIDFLPGAWELVGCQSD